MCETVKLPAKYWWGYANTQSITATTADANGRVNWEIKNRLHIRRKFSGNQ
jgi:hypothetical protein